MKKAVLFSASLIITLLTPSIIQAQHGHLNAGAVGHQPGDALVFANGEEFIASSGYVKTLTLATEGTYAGYYQGGITPTALFFATETGSAAPGAFLQMEIQSIEGPSGGQFGFWEHETTQPSHQIKAGESSPFRFNLSESDGSPGSEPGGHIHGRRWTATLPGIYKVRFQLFDTSTNGPNGGPIHAPSEPLEIYFQTGIILQSILPNQDHTQIRFGAQDGLNLQLQSNTVINGSTPWRAVGSVIVGTDHFVEILDEAPDSPAQFYRIIQLLP